MEILNMFSLEGKKAVITGGASILGFAFAKGLGKAGAEVALCDIVNAIAPGFLLIQQNRYLLLDENKNLTPWAKSIISHTPMGKFGDPEDLTGTCIWLASDTSKFVIGIIVPIDGGFNAYSGV